MNSSRKWTLLARCLHGEATIEEQEELSVLLQQDEILQRQYELLNHIWHDNKDDKPETGTLPGSDKINHLIYKAELAEYDQRASLRRLNRRRWWSAASVIFMLGLAAWFWQRSRYAVAGSGSADVPERLVAKNGSRIRSLLADGTTVWLNAGSSLEYVTDFSGRTREVRLTGEAYFDVIKMPERPFIVHTSDIDIRVLGTVFTVKSYPDDDSVETTLYHGSVKVLRIGDEEKNAVQLRPNQKFVLSRQAANKPEALSENEQPVPKELPLSFAILPIDSTRKESERIETAWLYSRLEFRGDNFEELARKLERWYNVKIVLTDEKVKKLSVDGSFEKETVAQAFAALKAGFPNLEYKINNNEIYVGLSD